ncbi:MAG: alkaline phosphatase family protein [Sphingobacteriales bacterium]|nr:alkaline phosphatase family protein [Sphingobacteriales bacterium]
MRFIALLLVAFVCMNAVAQNSPSNDAKLSRPKLVVGIAVDQMRWDYLYRYYNRYGNDGFKRLINQGFTCENTMIPYVPTVTACGHTCIYTGSIPAIHGITSNSWVDRISNKMVYCTDDDTVNPVGTTNTAQKMSPRNLWTTTIGDELKIATNFKSKVISVAIKDRASILPGGHSADAAYWFDTKTGNWITSTYYRMTTLPAWVQKFNDRKVADSLMKLNWKLSDAASTYVNSTDDDEWYEGKFSHEAKPIFDHELASQIGKNYDLLRVTPGGNTLTAMMAKTVIINEKLGQGTSTDMLAVSFSSPDGVGHAFGPNSREQEDDFLRLDKDLADFFNFLDTKIGKGQYLVFLSADHGVANIPGFLQEKKDPQGVIPFSTISKELNTVLKDYFKVDSIVTGIYNSQVHFNFQKITANNLNESAIRKAVISYLNTKDYVSSVVDLTNVNGSTVPAKIKEMITNGYSYRRSGDIQIILQPGWLEWGNPGTTHSTWYPYDAHIPLLFYGWNIKPGKLYRETYMTDIAATVSAMLHIQMPSGCIGKVIEEVMK